MKTMLSNLLFQQSEIWKNKTLKFIDKQKYWLFLMAAAYCAADLLILCTRPLLIPDKLPAPSLKSYRPAKTNSVMEYTAIWDFNIFHDGEIPPPLSSIASKDNIISPGVPILSHLPLQLHGTIVYRNPNYSIANITVKNKQSSEVFQVDDRIENLARITHIDSERVYFINLTTSQEEYIKLKEQKSISFQFQKKSADTKNTLPDKSLPSNSLVKKIGDFKFQVDRSNINKYLRNLPSILQDAKVVPHIENGRMAGFRFKYIKSGSVYEKLGFKVSDVLTSVNGEQLESELQATELFHRLQYKSKLDMKVKRKGKTLPFSWIINEDSTTDLVDASANIH